MVIFESDRGSTAGAVERENYGSPASFLKKIIKYIKEFLNNYKFFR